MAITFGPHCDYVSNSIPVSGVDTGIESISYTDQSGTTKTVGPSAQGTISDTVDYLNANLQSYRLFAVDGSTIVARLSENIIESMEYTYSGSTNTVTWSQIGGSCVELPIYAETQQASTVNSISEENVKEWATLELVIVAVMITILTATLFVKKL